MTKNLLVLFFGLIFIFFCLEIGTRLFWTTSDDFYQSDDKIGIIHIPNKEGIYLGKEFSNKIKINSHGFVGGDYAYQKEAGVFRAVILGDSLTEAMQVPLAENFCSLLENKLNEAEEGKYQIINLGMSSFGTGREYLTLKDYGLKYQPDLAILAFFGGNDVINNLTEEEEDPSFIINQNKGLKKKIKTFLLNNFELVRYIREKGYTSPSLRNFLIRIGLFSESKRMARETDQLENIPFDYFIYAQEYPDIYYQAWEKTKDFLDKFKQITDENGIKLLVIILPAQLRIYENIWTEIQGTYPAMKDKIWDLEKPDRILKEYLTEHDIEYLDLYPLMREAAASTTDGLYYKYDGHFAPAGHQVISQALFQYFLTNYLLDGIE